MSRFARVSACCLLTAALSALPLVSSASSYKVMFSFAPTGANPSSGLLTDAAGNAYGTTSGGGFNGAGTVYELSPTTGYHLLY